MTRFTASLAAGLIAAAGLAAPAAAQQQSQQTTTNISINDGDVEGYAVTVARGTEYKIEFDNEGVHSAYINDDEVPYEVMGGVVFIEDGNNVIEINVPNLNNNNNMPGRLPGLVAGQNFFKAAEPKTMVGLTQRAIDEQLRDHLELDAGVGTVIMSVIEGLPADKAGLRSGDVLIAVNAMEVDTADVLTSELAGLRAGDELDVTVLRKGIPETLTITVEAFDAKKLYGERAFDNRRFLGQGNVFRLGDDADDFDFDVDVDFDFDGFEDLLRDELAEIRELDDEQKEELDRAMAEAREQLAQAMKQAERARAIQWNLRGGNELLIRDLEDRDRALVIEREARDARDVRADRELARVEAEASRLRARNQQLEERLESLEAKLDRLLEHLEDNDSR